MNLQTSFLLAMECEEAQGIKSDTESNFLHAPDLAWNALARLELMLREMDGQL
jgi:hypothetical protein